MEQLGIALAGVIVGAVVSEGLRFWMGHVEDKRRLRSSLRLVGHELILTHVALTGPNLDGEEVREWVNEGTISIDRWMSHEETLAALLDTDDWTWLSQAYHAVRLLIEDAKFNDDDEKLLEVAKTVRIDTARAATIVRSKDSSPRGLQGRVRMRIRRK